MRLAASCDSFSQFQRMGVYMRSKLAVLGLVIIVCGAAAILGLANVLPFTGHAQAVPETALGVSPSALHQQVDVKSLPTQLIADPI